MTPHRSLCVNPPLALHFCDKFRRLAVFSEGFSEGALKNLRDGFPPDEEPYTDSYEYLSDSDLDETEGSTEADESLSDDTSINNSTRETVGVPDQEPAQASGVSSTIGISAEQATIMAGNSSGPESTHMQPGKVAIIRDTAATT